MKTAKRVLRGNTGADGSLDNDKASLALMQYLNTPLWDIDKSPAQLATGRHCEMAYQPSRAGYRSTVSGGRHYVNVSVKWGCIWKECYKSVLILANVLPSSLAAECWCKNNTPRPGTGQERSWRIEETDNTSSDWMVAGEYLSGPGNT